MTDVAFADEHISITAIPRQPTLVDAAQRSWARCGRTSAADALLTWMPPAPGFKPPLQPAASWIGLNEILASRVPQQFINSLRFAAELSSYRPRRQDRAAPIDGPAFAMLRTTAIARVYAEIVFHLLNCGMPVFGGCSTYVHAFSPLR